MMMPPGLRKLALTAHVATSVGWLGAVAAFLALSIVGLTSGNAEAVRGAYLAMNVVGGSIIVPLSLAALLTGVIQALGTQWGVVRYYWVVAKLTLTIGATFLLLLHQFTAVAAAASRVSGSASGTLPDLDGLDRQLVGDASFAVAVLLVTTTLSIYKPWGRTPFGGRVQADETSINRTSASSPMGVKILIAVIGAILLAFLAMHVVGRGFGHHVRVALLDQYPRPNRPTDQPRSFTDHKARHASCRIPRVQAFEIGHRMEDSQDATHRSVRRAKLRDAEVHRRMPALLQHLHDDSELLPPARWAAR